MYGLIHTPTNVSSLISILLYIYSILLQLLLLQFFIEIYSTNLFIQEKSKLIQNFRETT